MIINIGQKNRGKSVERVVLKDPVYVKWLLAKHNVYGPLASIKEEVVRLIKVFDAKPLRRSCYGHECRAPAVHLTVYATTTGFTAWCEACDPCQSGGSRHKLIDVRIYQEALTYVEAHCGGTKAAYAEVIKNLAQAKGLPKQAREQQIQEFFL